VFILTGIHPHTA